jgi:hypothetical protein
VRYSCKGSRPSPHTNLSINRAAYPNLELGFLFQYSIKPLSLYSPSLSLAASPCSATGAMGQPHTSLPPSTGDLLVNLFPVGHPLPPTSLMSASSTCRPLHIPSTSSPRGSHPRCYRSFGLVSTYVMELRQRGRGQTNVCVLQL